MTMQLSVASPNLNVTGLSDSSKDNLKTKVSNAIAAAVARQPDLQAVAGSLEKAALNAIDTVKMPTLPEPTTMNPNPTGLQKLAVTLSANAGVTTAEDGSMGDVTSVSMNITVTQAA
jgi:hypothetical protein